MADDNQSKKQTYNGSCHCGAVFYTVTIPSLTDPPREVIDCNCTNCSMHGVLLTHSLRTDLQIKRGVDVLQGYAYGSGEYLIRWCGKCGVIIGFLKTLDGELGEEEGMAINVRTLHDVDVWSLQVKKYTEGLTKGKPWERPTE